MKTITKFVTDDGKEFDNADDARAHEDAATFGALVGLKEEDIAAALSRTNITLADAFEKIGSRIAKKRLADGEKRRERRAVAPSPALTAALGVLANGATNEAAPTEQPAAGGDDRTEGLPL